MAKKETTQWVKPRRLGELDNAKLIKTDDGQFTPFQFRELYYKDAGQFNKMFYELLDSNKILIQV